MSTTNHSGNGRNIQWHPAFRSAIELELTISDPTADLQFEAEHLLNAAPLQIDLVITKRNSQLLHNEISRYFRRFNLFEYKSQNDQLSIDTFYKATAYAALFKSYGDTENAISSTEVTLTFVRSSIPAKLFSFLQKHHMAVARESPGIYRIENALFSTHFLILRELDPTQHLWLSNLCGNLSQERLRAILLTARSVDAKNQKKVRLVNSVIDVIIKVNETLFLKLLKEDSAMPDLIRDYFHVDELEATIADQEQTIADQGQTIADLGQALARYKARFGELPDDPDIIAS